MVMQIPRMVLLIVVSSVFVQPAMGETKPDTAPHGGILSSMEVSGESCDALSAKPMELKHLLKQPEAHIGECVTTVGYYESRALFLRKRDTKTKFPTQNDKVARHRIGLYGSEQKLVRLEAADNQKASVTGLISDCSTLYANFIMVMGYCHYTDGPILILSNSD